MRETNYLQINISGLQRTAGPYRSARIGISRTEGVFAKLESLILNQIEKPLRAAIYSAVIFWIVS
jgi:hypothetical protein